MIEEKTIDKKIREKLIVDYKKRFNDAHTSKELSVIKKEFYSMNYNYRILDNIWEEITREKRYRLLEALDFSSIRLINSD